MAQSATAPRQAFWQKFTAVWQGTPPTQTCSTLSGICGFGAQLEGQRTLPGSTSGKLLLASHFRRSSGEPTTWPLWTCRNKWGGLLFSLQLLPMSGPFRTTHGLKMSYRKPCQRGFMPQWLKRFTWRMSWPRQSRDCSQGPMMASRHRVTMSSLARSVVGRSNTGWPG